MSSRVTLNQVLTIVNTLENLIKQCFGPNALNIMLCTATGKLVLTSSGTTILRAVNVEHPVGKMIIDSIQSHHALTGNNSKTFIFLLKTLLQELRIEQDRMNVSLGLSIVQKWLLPEIGFDVLKLCTKVNLKNIEHVKCACQFIVYTSLQGKLNSIAIKRVTRIIIDAMFYETMDSQQILQTVRQNIDDIDLFCIENPGQPISSSLYIPGIIVQRELIPFPKIKGQLRCVLLSCDLLIESEVTIQTSTREQLTQALVWKMRFMKLLIASLKEHGINLVISRQQLDKDVCSEMVSSNIYVMTSVLEEDMLRISTSTGVLPISEHGRLKVKTTAEQEEAKRKEREKKLQLYTAGTNKAFEKRRNKEYDEEALEVTTQLLSANPDVYSLWNFRKEILAHFKQTKPAEVSKLFDSELGFVEQCLRHNPKSYGAWEQRCWVLLTRDDPDWGHELGLCNKYLEYDERNFHCWDYRRWIIAHSNQVSPQNELDFTTAKITANFSNYSSWHYRSKLLPQVHPDPSQPSHVAEDVLLKEFELAQNAFFTDPSDQSAWFYHRWLLGRGERELQVECIHVSRDMVTVVLSKHAQVGVDCRVQLTVDGVDVSCEWQSASDALYCNVWRAAMSEGSLAADVEHSVSVAVSADAVQSSATDGAGDGASLPPPASHGVSLLPVEDDAWWWRPVPSGTRFTAELSAAKSSILTTELESCQQLDELEPNNKWVLLTIVWLMRAIDPLKYEQQTLEYLSKLKEVDSMRARYYDDLTSKYVMENAVETHPDGSRIFSLSNKRLSAFYHSEYLATMQTINLSQNSLPSLRNGFMLVCVKVLNLDNNQLTSCKGMENMSSLQMLSIKSNNISEVSNLEALSTCTRLSVLYIEGNPVAEDKEQIRSLLTNVVEIQ